MSESFHSKIPPIEHIISCSLGDFSYGQRKDSYWCMERELRIDMSRLESLPSNVCGIKSSNEL